MRLHAPRSLVAGALAASLVTVPVLAPPAVAAPPAQASCGSLGPPVCDLLVTVKVLLAPLEPVFAMGIPLTDALGATVHGLQSTLEQVIGNPEAVNAQLLAQQIGDLLDLLTGVPEPVASTMSLLGLGQLRAALTEVQASLQSQAAVAAVDQPPVEAAVDAAPSLPTAGVLQRAGRTAAAVPAVPDGATLDLPELGLPDLGSRPDRSTAARAAAPAADELAAPTLPAGRQQDSPGQALAGAVALGSLLFAAGLLASRGRFRRCDEDAQPAIELVP